MGCWPSKTRPSSPPYMPSFRVMNVPSFPPSSTETSRLTPAPSSASPAPTHKIDYIVERPSNTPTSEQRGSQTALGSSDYNLNYQLATLPDFEPLSLNYRAYQPSPRPLLQQQHPPALVPAYTGFPFPNPTPRTRASPTATTPAPATLPFRHIDYPPLPEVPRGNSLEDVLAARGKRNWKSLHVAKGREMASL
ncbi:MAG: hypothetical protein LQ344_005467 [Seirophora lacunosa]|nr:MAG: hypothetical protein LQ344_005467 [Seirophora lacunosa]